MGATVRIALCSSDSDGWYIESWVYCRKPERKTTPVVILTNDDVDDWIIDFVIKYKMYQTRAYEKINQSYLTEALMNGEI